MLRYLDKDAKICGNCIHFYLHYIKNNDHYVSIHWGHCVYPRLKTRNDIDSCLRWEAISKKEGC